MVGLLIISHSRLLAEGLRDLLAQMQPQVGVAAAGGLPDGSLGTSVDVILAALQTLQADDGILALLDLGSAVMSAEMAVESLPESARARIILSDAPFVEGAVLAAISAGLGMSLAQVAESAQEGRAFPKHVGGEPDRR